MDKRADVREKAATRCIPLRRGGGSLLTMSDDKPAGGSTTTAGVNNTRQTALVALHAGGRTANPYVGILIVFAIPAVFFAGLILIPIGSWLGCGRSGSRWSNSAAGRGSTGSY